MDPDSNLHNLNLVRSASHKSPIEESSRFCGEDGWNCGWAIEVTEIMLSLIEGSTGPLPDYAKKEIDTFTDKIAQEYFIQLQLMTCDCYQKLLTHKNAICQPKRVGARETEDKASTKERTEDAEDGYVVGYVGPTYDAQEEKE